MARAQVDGLCWHDANIAQPVFAPGLAIRVDPASWEDVNISLGGPTRVSDAGYRYLQAAADGSVCQVIGDYRVPLRR